MSYEEGYDEGYRAGMQKMREVGQARKKCIVKDCENHTDQGGFTGDLCNPCHAFITKGSGLYSQAYRNAQREWVGLTEVEIRYALREWAETNQTCREMMYAIEDKLKEKNNG